jgi:CRISPR/Cas system CMR-associated protein Cmr1 (group 7 of RAMP superfamily)
VIRQTRFHRGRYTQRLVNPAKVEVHEVERNHVAVVLYLLTETVR